MQENRGFTLIELSVVLAIIGLILGATVGAQGLIHGMKLKNVMTELQHYHQAITTFKEKYHYFPGDFKTATELWEDSHNGDGDWVVEGDITERLYAWQHLQLAGLIEGSYTGAVSTPNQHVNVNVPGSVFKNNLYMLGSNVTGEEIFGRLGTSLQYSSNAAEDDPYGGALMAKDAYFLDHKLDDGSAYHGEIFAVDGSTSTEGYCSAPFNEEGTDFDLSQSGTDCRLVFWLSY